MSKNTPLPLIIFASLAALAVNFARYRPPTAEERAARNDRRRREREQREARNAQTRAELTRNGDRWRLYERPEIKGEWERMAYDRFEAPSAPMAVEEVKLGPNRFRGPTPVRLTDRSSGDQLEIIGGDVADNWYVASIRVGLDGIPQRVLFSRGLDEKTGRELVSVGKEVDGEGMRALARLFNAPSRLLPLGSKRPVVLTRVKQPYRGHDAELYDREIRDFLDRHVDEHYAAKGMDPNTGRKKG